MFSDNPYHIQAYFDCLINTYYKQPDNELLFELLEKIGRIKSEKAQSMYGRCKSLYLAYVYLYDKLTFKRDELQKKYQSADEIIVNQKNNTAIMPAEMSWYDRRFS